VWVEGGRGRGGRFGTIDTTEVRKANRTWNDKGWWGFLAASPPLLEVAAVAMVLCWMCGGGGGGGGGGGWGGGGGGGGRGGGEGRVRWLWTEEEAEAEKQHRFIE